MDKNITIDTECGGVNVSADKCETKAEKDSEKESAKAGVEGEFIASARLHARKFDKDVVYGEKRGVLNEVEVRIMRDERVRRSGAIYGRNIKMSKREETREK